MNDRDAAVLAAFRAVTGWPDDLVLHYAQCPLCNPICGHEEENCQDAPAWSEAEPFPHPETET